MGNSFKSMLRFQIRKGSFEPTSSLGTSIISSSINPDGIILEMENGFTTSIYSYIADNAYVSELSEFKGRFAMDVTISGNIVNVRVKSTKTKEYVTLNNMYSTMTLGFSCIMELILDPVVTSLSKSINTYTYSTIQSRDTIGNVNVYVNDDGQTNYFDSTIPIKIDVGTMSFSTTNGEYKVGIVLSKVGNIINVKPETDSFPYIVSSSYSNNNIILTCSRSANGFLLAGITNATTGVPYKLLLNPTYSGNVINIGINGTNLDNVPNDFIINITLMITILS